MIPNCIELTLRKKRTITKGWPEELYCGILQDICITPDNSIFIITNWHKKPGYVLDENLMEITPKIQKHLLPTNALEPINGPKGKQNNPHTICVNETEIFIGGSHEMGAYGEISRYDRATGSLTERIMTPSVDDLEIIGNELYAVVSSSGGSKTCLVKFPVNIPHNKRRIELLNQDVDQIVKRGQNIYALQGNCRDSRVTYKIIEFEGGRKEKEICLEYKTESGFNKRRLEIDAAGNILLFERSPENCKEALMVFSPEGKYMGKKEMSKKTPFELFRFNNKEQLINVTTRAYICRGEYYSSLDVRVFDYTAPNEQGKLIMPQLQLIAKE